MTAWRVAIAFRETAPVYYVVSAASAAEAMVKAGQAIAKTLREKAGSMIASVTVEPLGSILSDTDLQAI